MVLDPPNLVAAVVPLDRRFQVINLLGGEENRSRSVRTGLEQM
jgi:hypothetical protein